MALTTTLARAWSASKEIDKIIMNTQESFIARLMFKVKVLAADGQQFENLFVSIMGYARPGFSSYQAPRKNR